MKNIFEQWVPPAKRKGSLSGFIISGEERDKPLSNHLVSLYSISEEQFGAEDPATADG